MLLVELDVKVLLEKRREAERFYAEKLSGYPRIEDVRDAPAVILPQQAQVIIRVMKDDLDRPVLEKIPQIRKARSRQRIDDGAFFTSRQLKEIDAVVKAVEARALGVESDLRARTYLREKALDG